MADYNASRRLIKAVRPDLVGMLPNRNLSIKGVILHSTRSGRQNNDDGPGTENWFNHPDNPGGMADMLVFGTGQQVKCTNWESGQQPLWGAGMGDVGTWSTQNHYLQCEVSQGTIDSPFTPQSVDSTAQWVGELARIYNFPLVRIPFLSQIGVAPAGIGDHANCANGVKLGKSDVGPMFPWELFLSKATACKGGDGEGMTEAELKRLADLEMHVAQLRTQAWGEGPNGTPPPMRDSKNPYADATMYHVEAMRNGGGVGSGTYVINGTVTLKGGK